MSEITVVYWRDIPAQVIAGSGRRAAKVPLPERFEQAIDRAAMKSGAAGTDAYLAEWRKGPVDLPGDAPLTVEDAAARIEAHYDTGRIKALIDGNGWAAS